MAIYLISFAVSLVIIGLTEKRRKEYFIFFSIIALLIPCLVAGLRGENVGTDVHVYIQPMVKVAKNSESFKEYWNGSWFHIWRDKFVYEHEIGFAAVLYWVTRLTGHTSAVLFAIQAMTVVPIFIALARNRKEAPVWPGMLMYYLMYFNSTLNMMRQWMAMGFLLLAFRMLMEKKYWLCGLFSVIAFSFHYSALIVIPIYMIWWFLRLFRKHTLVQGNIQISSKMLIIVLIFCCGYVVIKNLNIVLKLMIAMGFGRFSNYISGNGVYWLVNQVILRTPLLTVAIYSWSRLKKATPHAAFFLTMMLLDLLAAQIASMSAYAFRIAFYFAQYAILALPYLFKYQKSHFEKTMVALLMTAFYTVYWYYTYALVGHHQTIPYEFGFLR